jgi:tripartite-type tricarboxylate transporter receptor subunit TctC
VQCQTTGKRNIAKKESTMPLIRPLMSVVIALSSIIFSAAVLAQNPVANFPNRPVTIVLPFTPGASTDIETRLYQQRLMEGLKQPVLIDYKPGAGSSLGSIYVAKSVPDGYTILAITPGFSVYPAFFPLDKLPYDPIKDFAPLSLVNKRTALLLVHPSLGVKTYQEYIAYAKANPGKINFGTSGGGGIFHIAGAWLHSATNTSATFVHYKGAGPMNLDLIAGRISAAPGLPFVVGPYIKSGKVIAIASLTAERSKFMPDLVPVAEMGVPGYDYSSWSGYLAPARTPDAIVNRWSAEFTKVAKAPEIVSRMEADSAEMVGSTPEVFRKLLVTQVANWRKVVQENTIKLEE